jgi:hypothetical protein
MQKQAVKFEQEENEEQSSKQSLRLPRCLLFLLLPWFASVPL